MIRKSVDLRKKLGKKYKKKKKKYCHKKETRNNIVEKALS